MKRQITKEMALQVFGGPLKTAKALNVTSGAISQWEPGRLIPELQEYRIRDYYEPVLYDLFPECRPDKNNKLRKIAS